MPECSVENCVRPIKARGMCRLHYQRSWRTGSVEVSRPCLHGSVEERFWNHVTKGCPDQCWPWQGFRDPDGYGHLRVESGNPGAHIVAWEIAHGPVPPGKMVLHKCDNPPCVNENHLKLGNHDANMRDRRAAGHYLTGESHPQAKVSDATVAEIRATPGRLKDLATRFGLSESQIGNIRRGDQRQ